MKALQVLLLVMEVLEVIVRLAAQQLLALEL
jgi:hypothetical protein